uniref:Protein kinase domain-containing protein n=1 Tax=Triticum urartu TaxID=4572 RepID=A0A8R7V2L2_TRIUA
MQSYSFRDLDVATIGFADVLGRGASGMVVKGVLANRNKEIVVKRPEKMAEDGVREFHREVRAIARTHHRHLLCLLGFCIEDTCRLLVYEYIP